MSHGLIFRYICWNFITSVWHNILKLTAGSHTDSEHNTILLFIFILGCMSLGKGFSLRRLSCRAVSA